MIVLDTNVLSAMMQAEPDPRVVTWLDRQPRTSMWSTSISVLEIRYGLASMPQGRRRELLSAAFAILVEEKIEQRILPFDRAAAEETAIIMSSWRRAGQTRDLRDSMIAGIVVAHHATLATANVRHFDDLTTPVVNPWQN